MLFAIGGLFSPENVEAVIRNCLLVLGGFMFGYLLGWLLGIAANRYLAKGKAPLELQQLIRLICGIIVAVLVALKVFGGSGKGPGDGGPGGNGNGESNAAPQTPGDAPNDPKETPKDPPPDSKKGATEGYPEIPVTVRLLGGNNAGGEKRDLVYQIGDDPAAPKLNLADVQKALLQKQQEAGERKIRVIFVRPGSDEDRVPESSATWIQLQRWLIEKKIAPFDR